VTRIPTIDYCAVRTMTERLAEPLGPEDQTVQSMPDVSPTKWHRAHVTWFFETFVLGRFDLDHRSIDDRYGYLFNSYYEAVGARHPRAQRGLLSRPTADEVGEYRRHVDASMLRLLDTNDDPELHALVELGLHHEQQHQELLLMDAKHVLSCNPLYPVYGDLPWRSGGAGRAGWQHHDGGVFDIGHVGGTFAFDNEGPRHAVLLRPFVIATGLVTNADWVEFIDDGGYVRPDLWMSDGWAGLADPATHHPAYWQRSGSSWRVFTLGGLTDLDPGAPVQHVSWYEADAFARWRGARLPTEAEWEVAAPRPDDDGEGVEQGWYGAVWQWTASPYTPYPGFAAAPGAVGEYNGKFMVNQQVLRGSAWATPPGHARRTYRNFFPPSARWCVSGVRLARDA
jgi:ergothioneine biosynthesis protein EgtB